MPGLTENDLRFARAAGYRIPLDRVREQLEPERPKIHVTLTPTTNINDLLDKFTPTKEDMDKMFESRRRMAKEYEACLLGFALVHKVWKFYEVLFTVDSFDQKGISRFDTCFKLFLHKNEASGAGSVRQKRCGVRVTMAFYTTSYESGRVFRLVIFHQKQTKKEQKWPIRRIKRLP